MAGAVGGEVVDVVTDLIRNAQGFAVPVEDGLELLSAGSDQSVRLWNLAERKEIASASLGFCLMTSVDGVIRLLLFVAVGDGFVELCFVKHRL